MNRQWKPLTFSLEAVAANFCEKRRPRNAQEKRRLSAVAPRVSQCLSDVPALRVGQRGWCRRHGRFEGGPERGQVKPGGVQVQNQQPEVTARERLHRLTGIPGHHQTKAGTLEHGSQPLVAVSTPVQQKDGRLTHGI